MHLDGCMDRKGLEMSSMGYMQEDKWRAWNHVWNRNFVPVSMLLNYLHQQQKNNGEWLVTSVTEISSTSVLRENTQFVFT